MDTVWEWVTGLGGIAGLIALSLQGLSGWRKRNAPRDLDGLRKQLDLAHTHLLPLVSRITHGTPSLDIVADEDGTFALIGLTRYANRLCDKVLSEALSKASFEYQLAFAIGTNLNLPPSERPDQLVTQQVQAAKESMKAVNRAASRLDEIERKIGP